MAAVVPQHEVDRRYGLVREAMARDGLDYVIVSGNEYSGFEGAVTYMAGFVIVHRYAYVLLPREGEPSIVEASEHLAAGEDVGLFLEDDGDDGEALDGFRAHRFQADQAIDGDFERAGDEQLDLFRCQAGTFGLDDDLGLNKIRKNIELGGARDVEAVAENYNGQHQHHAAESERKMD